MISTRIYFQFEREEAAGLAFQTFDELGFHPHVDDQDRSRLHIHLDNPDLASALQIAMSHGGQLVEDAVSGSEEQLYSNAYELDNFIPVPAHVVNEDWVDGYSDPKEDVYDADTAGLEEDEHDFDPSEDDYSYFRGGIHL
jgi:hypothetical protein